MRAVCYLIIVLSIFNIVMYLTGVMIPTLVASIANEIFFILIFILILRNNKK